MILKGEKIESNLNKNDVILIVDDDSAVRDFLKRYLIQKGFTQVIAVGSGEEAFKQMASVDIKLVFLDVKMPDLNGIDAGLKR